MSIKPLQKTSVPFMMPHPHIQHHSLLILWLGIKQWCSTVWRGVSKNLQRSSRPSPAVPTLAAHHEWFQCCQCPWKFQCTHYITPIFFTELCPPKQWPRCWKLGKNSFRLAKTRLKVFSLSKSEHHIIVSCQLLQSHQHAEQHQLSTAPHTTAERWSNTFQSIPLSQNQAATCNVLFTFSYSCEGSSFFLL